jgi:hypothetical protein
LPGNLVLGGQRCLAGRVLVGFLANGTLICESPGGQGAKVIFLSASQTHGTFNGQLKLAGADLMCQVMASSANLPGTYKAWLSDNSISAADRLTHATVPYVLPNGTVVADNWAGLVSGTLAQPISMDEYGDIIPASSSQVWTGTNSDGSAAVENCQDWAQETIRVCAPPPLTFCFDVPIRGQIGDASRTDTGWSGTPLNAQSQYCNVDARLYCVQQ